MEQLSFKLDAFEGPLDLLLALIKKNKVNIYDIPIAEILEQYMQVMDAMKETDLEVSSEFLVLAATLLQIKSKMLLPKDEEDEDEEDPRTELVRRLVEYRQIKESLGFFREHENAGADLFFKLPDAIERPPVRYSFAEMTADKLLEAYNASFFKLERKLPPPKRSFSGIVGHEKVSVRERVRRIWNGLISRGKMLFRDIFEEVTSKAEAVASFLALLEMVKMNKIAVEQESDKIGDYSVTRLTDDTGFDFDEIED